MFQVKRDKKQAERAAHLQRARDALGDTADTLVADDLDILSATIPEMVAKVTVEKSWTATRVLQAYVRAALRAQEATNCLTEIFMAEALAEAKGLDEEFARTGRAKGRLHGVPMAIKDNLAVAGRDSSIGASRFVGVPAEEDALIVTILRAEGALIFAKTNIPQTMLSFECGNPIFGTTTNPLSALQTSGGSSGGSAALLACDGAMATIGSDIAGSLRLPAHMSGVFALKPMGGRFPMQGTRPAAPGSESVTAATGPMARTMEETELLARIVIERAQDFPDWTTRTVPLPWKAVTLPKRLKIGYYIDDNFVRTSPACRRAVELSIAALREAGHEMVELEPADTFTAVKLFVAMSSSDGYQSRWDNIAEGDPVEPSLYLLRLGSQLPAFARSLMVRSMRWRGDDKLADVFALGGLKSVYELQQWQAKRSEFVVQLRKRYWEELALDAVICPVIATPAVGVHQSKRLSPLGASTLIYNVVDSPVAVVTVAHVDAALDARPTDLTEEDKGFSKLTMTELYCKQGEDKVYDPAGRQKELPLGVQIVGAPYEDEKVLKVAGELSRLLGDRGFGPGAYTRRMLAGEQDT